MTDLNNPIIKNVTQHEGNVHLAVYPFFHNSINMMTEQGYYRDHEGSQMTDWEKSLADKLWETIPSLAVLFFNNGEITIQHHRLLSDEEVVEMASSIILPYLTANMIVRRTLLTANEDRVR